MKRLMYFTMCLCTMLVVLSCSKSSSDKNDGGKSSYDMSCSKNSSDKNVSDKSIYNNPIIGKWEQTINQGSAAAVVTYNFKESGKLIQTMVMKNASPAINIDGEGTCEYTYKDNTITFKFSASDYTFNKFSIEGMSDDMIDAAMEEMKSEMVNMEQSFTNVKIDGDKLTANFNGQKVELKRIR